MIRVVQASNEKIKNRLKVKLLGPKTAEKCLF